MTRVLIVEDEECLGQTFAVLLKDAGYETVLAEDAPEALALLKTQEVDVVLADIALPCMSGLELVRLIRNASPRVQAILMTGMPTVETATEAVRAGAIEYLHKPFSRETLLRAVGAAARLKSVDDERLRLAEANKRHQEELERLVAERTAELTASREQLRSLSQRLQALREEERTRISREIHDHLGQLLSALKLDLRSISRRLAGLESSPLREDLSAKTQLAMELADETIVSVQKIASELRPGILDRLGLEAAVESDARAFQARMGIACDLDLPKTRLAIPQEQITAAFRIFQEILTNIARHAQAARVAIRLAQEGGHLLLVVRDDGIGIRDQDLQDPRSLGLLGMRERAENLGGAVTYARNPDRGTTVTMRIPLETPGGPSPCRASS
jgi:signal transduction histidine kinase